MVNRKTERQTSAIIQGRFDRPRTEPHSVLIVAPSPPPYGGMALQARLLEKLLAAEGNLVTFFASNMAFPRWLPLLDRVPGLRTFVRFALIWPRLWTAVRKTEVVHILAASWLYFFLVVSPAAIAGRVCRKWVVINYRGGGAETFFRRWRWFAKPVFQLADAVTAPSEFLGDVIRRMIGVPVSIVPNILDASAFTYRERATLRPNILITRHLEKIYDIETVLKAFRVVQDHFPEAVLWIVGTGSEEKRLRNLVAEWSLQNVRFIGEVTHCELPAVCDQCDIFLNASRIDNFPGALLEASAAGLVVVSTRAGGIAAMYENEKNALLVEIGDWQGLAAGVETVLKFPQLALTLTREANQLVRSCDWKEVRKSLYLAYGFGPDYIDKACSARREAAETVLFKAKGGA